MSNGALFGQNSIALNSSCPSTEKCFTAACSPNHWILTYKRQHTHPELHH